MGCSSECAFGGYCCYYPDYVREQRRATREEARADAAEKRATRESARADAAETRLTELENALALIGGTLRKPLVKLIT